ncbi:acyl transferase [Spirosoma areae]
MSFSLTLSPAVIPHRQLLRQKILTLASQRPNRELFESVALAVFRYQAVYNPVYAAYLSHLHSRPEQLADLRQIPFMPIGFFKHHTLLTGVESPGQLAPNQVLTFASSGTTGPQTSRHVVPDPALYETISTGIFERAYGPLSNVHILALLPSYLERNNSSLVYMVQRFIAQTGLNQSAESTAAESTGGFFLHNHTELTERLRQLTQQADGKQILLIGVTFGLLDWVESGQDLSFLRHYARQAGSNFVVMETGGMKGRRKELLREEVHKLLTKQLGVQSVHSEYGMTELLSQAYSPGGGVFRPSSTLRVYLRDINDPFLLYPNDPNRPDERRTGGINVVDLGNLDSCAFIETQDLGQYEGTSGDFRVIGRFDNSDVRGCNLMVD